MSDDLISRQAAIDALRAHEDYKGYLHCDYETILEELPPAEQEPKRGKWIKHTEVKNVYGGIYIECSECGEKYVVQHVADEKFCRNCGADMKGGE